MLYDGMDSQFLPSNFRCPRRAFLTASDGAEGTVGMSVKRFAMRDTASNGSGLRCLYYHVSLPLVGAGDFSAFARFRGYSFCSAEAEGTLEENRWRNAHCS
jgi:hypothetical protein